jgi:hypothetical protein
MCFSRSTSGSITESDGGEELFIGSETIASPRCHLHNLACTLEGHSDSTGQWTTTHLPAIYRPFHTLASPCCRAYPTFAHLMDDCQNILRSRKVYGSHALVRTRGAQDVATVWHSAGPQYRGIRMVAQEWLPCENIFRAKSGSGSPGARPCRELCRHNGLRKQRKK